MGPVLRGFLRGSALPNGVIVGLVAVLVGLTLAVAAAAILRTPAGAKTSAPTPGATPSTSAAADSGTKTAVFVGDAYTVGTGSNGNTGFVDSVAKQLGWQAVNVSVPGAGYIVRGDTDKATAQAQCDQDYCRDYNELIGDIVAANPDVVVVSGGRVNVNDKTADLALAIPAFYVDLRAALPDATIYAVSPIWDDTQPPDALSTIGDDVNRSVTAVGGTYLNIGQPLVNHPDLLVAGTVYPNDQGYSAIAAAIVQQIRSS